MVGGGGLKKLKHPNKNKQCATAKFTIKNRPNDREGGREIDTEKEIVDGHRLIRL